MRFKADKNETVISGKEGHPSIASAKMYKLGKKSGSTMALKPGVRRDFCANKYQKTNSPAKRSCSWLSKLKSSKNWIGTYGWRAAVVACARRSEAPCRNLRSPRFTG